MDAVGATDRVNKLTFEESQRFHHPLDLTLSFLAVRESLEATHVVVDTVGMAHRLTERG